jgi:hypothetical protein
MSHCLSLPYKKPTKPQGRTRKVQKFSKTNDSVSLCFSELTKNGPLLVSLDKETMN